MNNSPHVQRCYPKESPKSYLLRQAGGLRAALSGATEAAAAADAEAALAGAGGQSGSGRDSEPATLVRTRTDTSAKLPRGSPALERGAGGVSGAKTARNLAPSDSKAWAYGGSGSSRSIDVTAGGKSDNSLTSNSQRSLM